ncbi:YwqG family protein [Actinoplanes cyaneus]|nr:YwqG family protein [Actinoplanes cyaneus]
MGHPVAGLALWPLSPSWHHAAMDHQGRFRRAALASGIPDDEASRFLQHLRLSIRLSGGSGGVPVGQFGGLPRLPVGMDWPSAGVTLLPFIFSVDCAALPRIDGFSLPADGSLLFFLEHEQDHLAAGEQNYGRVVYVPPGTDTEVAAGSTDSPTTGDQYDVHATLRPEYPDWFGADGDEEEEDEDDLSPFQQQLARDLERDLPHLDELRALADDLWPPFDRLASAYIGGYADEEVIRGIAEQTLAWREKTGEIVIPIAKWYSHLEKEMHQLTSEWVSLARFPAADEFYYGSFVIRQDDLAAGRLDKALSVTEFSE